MVFKDILEESVQCEKVNYNIITRLKLLLVSERVRGSERCTYNIYLVTEVVYNGVIHNSEINLFKAVSLLVANEIYKAFKEGIKW